MDPILHKVYLVLCEASYNKESIQNVLTILHTFEQELKKIKDIPGFLTRHENILRTIQFNLYLITTDVKNAPHKNK